MFWLPARPATVIASAERIASSCSSVSRPRSRTRSRIGRPVATDVLGDLRRRGVADVRAERRGERGAAIEQLAAARRVGGDAVDAARPAATRIASRRMRRRVQRVPRDDRHHDVQLELAGVGRRQRSSRRSP